MKDLQQVQPFPPMKLLPAYTGLSTIEEILKDPRAVRLLWLEILVNEHLDISHWQHHPAVQQAYEKACQWFTAYKSLINSMIARHPLPHNSQPIDFREYRVFAEALRFATAHS